MAEDPSIDTAVTALDIDVAYPVGEIKRARDPQELGKRKRFG